MDDKRLQLLLDNLKTSLSRKLTRDVLVFLMFCLASAVLWLFQTLHEDYETEVQIACVLTNVPNGVIVTEDLPPQLSVTVKDRGSTLVSYLWKEMPPLAIDFSLHDQGQAFGHVVLSHNEIQRMLFPLLQSSTRIVSLHPDTLVYYFNRGVKKRLPVTFHGDVETSPQHYLEAVRIEPDSVTVWGDKAVLDSMKTVSTMVTNLSGLTRTHEQMVDIAPIRGAKIEPQQVMITAEVDVYTDKKVRVPIVGTNFPGGYNLRTFPSSVLVSFSIGSRQYKKVTAENFVITATYEELLEQPDSMLTLQLRSVPEGVTQVKIIPERVQFLIEKTYVE